MMPNLFAHQHLKDLRGYLTYDVTFEQIQPGNAKQQHYIVLCFKALRFILLLQQARVDRNLKKKRFHPDVNIQFIGKKKRNPRTPRILEDKLNLQISKPRLS